MADILHRDLADSELHEVKGSFGATLNHVLTSDGSNSATFVDPNTIIDAVEEAPEDGHLYCRRNAEWIISPSDPAVLHYQVNSGTTNPPPGAQDLKFNNAVQTNATEIYFDEEDQIGRKVSSVLLAASIGAGNLVITDGIDLGHSQTWDIVSIADNGGYITYVVANPVFTGIDFTDDQPIDVKVS